MQTQSTKKKACTANDRLTFQLFLSCVLLNRAQSLDCPRPDFERLQHLGGHLPSLLLIADGVSSLLIKPAGGWLLTLCKDKTIIQDSSDILTSPRTRFCFVSECRSLCTIRVDPCGQKVRARKFILLQKQSFPNMPPDGGLKQMDVRFHSHCCA